MKRTFIGAIVLIAAIAFAGCNNSDEAKKKEMNEREKLEKAGANAQAEKPQLPNRLLIIVDPQVDFTTGSLATAKGPAAMDYLAKKLS